MDRAAFYQLTKGRSTCRSYQPDPIPDQVMDRILKAGCSSPSAGNFQHLSIIQVTDPEKREALAQCSRGQGFIAVAPVSLVFCIDHHRAMQVGRIESFPTRENRVLHSFWMGLADVSICAQTVALAAEAEGLASCLNGNIINVIDRVDSLLSLPELVVPALMLTLGYPKVQGKQAPKYSPDLLVHDNAYQIPDAQEVYKAYREHNNNREMPPKAELVECIYATAERYHGKAQAEAIRDDISAKGYIGPYQYWMGAYYLDGEGFMDYDAYARYLARKGFHWLRMGEES